MAAADVTAATRSLFDRAYHYYRLKRDVPALNVLAKMADQEEQRVLELRAQIFYRQERFVEALELFTKLVRTHSDQFDDIRRANVIAVKARLQEAVAKNGSGGGGGTQVPVDDRLDQLETFEQMYNTACQLLSAGRVVEAVTMLDKAIAECQMTLKEDDGLSPEEIECECAPLLAQRAYAWQRLGRARDALPVYTQLLKLKSLGQKTRETILVNLKSDDFVRYGRKYRVRKPAIEEAEKRPKTKKLLPQLAAAVSAAGKTAKRRRLPANYDPEVAPDPERWLPRHERTAYKKRRMNKRQKEREIGKGTQGASSSASGAGGGGAATIDYSRQSPSGSTEPASAPTAQGSPKPTPPPAQRHAGAAAKKAANKKKRGGGGGKW